MRALAVGTVLAFALACGSPKPPVRAVIESDVEGWTFQRYQALLDVEVWVPENRAAAHTASYVSKDALKRGRLGEPDVVNAFVTRYKKDEGIVQALVKFVRRLAQESGYVVEEREVGGVRLFWVSGAGEVWGMWAAPNHVVKIGGRGRDEIPDDIVEAYAERYPSAIKDGMLEGDISDDPAPEIETQDENFDPDNPKPDWDHKQKKNSDD
jgi:hypothetical protein